MLKLLFPLALLRAPLSIDISFLVKGQSYGQVIFLGLR